MIKLKYMGNHLDCLVNQLLRLYPHCFPLIPNNLIRPLERLNPHLMPHIKFDESYSVPKLGIDLLLRIMRETQAAVLVEVVALVVVGAIEQPLDLPCSSGMVLDQLDAAFRKGVHHTELGDGRGRRVEVLYASLDVTDIHRAVQLAAMSLDGMGIEVVDDEVRMNIEAVDDALIQDLGPLDQFVIKLGKAFSSLGGATGAR